MRREAWRGRGAARAGFSLLELIMAMMVASVVILGVMTVVMGENARMSFQRELSDTWLTLRSAAELISFDLRQASASGGDLAAISATSFTIRSRLGSGVICARSGTEAVFALTGVTGEDAAVGDSVQVMTVEPTPVWRTVRVAAAGAPGVIGPAVCVYGGAAPTTGIRLEVGTPIDTTNVTVGSAVHAFRSTQYGIMTHEGRRWLGRRVGGASSWDVLTGPLRTDGLRLTYYTSAGATTTTPAEVAAVRISLRAESYGRLSKGRTIEDTLSMRIRLRN